MPKLFALLIWYKNEALGCIVESVRYIYFDIIEHHTAKGRVKDEMLMFHRPT